MWGRLSSLPVHRTFQSGLGATGKSPQLADKNVCPTQMESPAGNTRSERFRPVPGKTRSVLRPLRPRGLAAAAQLLFKSLVERVLFEPEYLLGALAHHSGSWEWGCRIAPLLDPRLPWRIQPGSEESSSWS